MNVLMIEVPTTERDGDLPFGLLYAASSAYRSGHNVKILDLVKDNLEYAEIKKIIREFSPRIIGLGGITSSYKNCKELVRNIKRDFGGIQFVVGGVLSSVPELLFKKVGIDFIVCGEAELTFPSLLGAIENNSSIENVKGISYMDGLAIRQTEIQEPVKNLDTIPMPELGLVDVDRYIRPAKSWADEYFKYDRNAHRDMLSKLSGRKMFSIITSRGCTHRCIFCYRHSKGLRQHSVEYAVNMIKRLKGEYGISVFQICDELTTANRAWVAKLCDTIINEGLGIYFIMMSSRADNVDEDILLKLKEAGCIMINYGYESGSDAILREIKKGATREQNLRAGLLTKKAGIKNVPEIIIGFPSETEETVEETIDFLKKMDWPISINTPIPFPQTPLWDYALEHKLIGNEENFILGYKRRLLVNFTRFTDRKLRYLVNKVGYDVRLHWLKKNKKYGLFLLYFIDKILVMHLNLNLPLLLKNIYSKIKCRA